MTAHTASSDRAARSKLRAQELRVRALPLLLLLPAAAHHDHGDDDHHRASDAGDEEASGASRRSVWSKRRYARADASRCAARRTANGRYARAHIARLEMRGRRNGVMCGRRNGTSPLARANLARHPHIHRLRITQPEEVQPLRVLPRKMRSPGGIRRPHENHISMCPFCP